MRYLTNQNKAFFGNNRNYFRNEREFSTKIPKKSDICETCTADSYLNFILKEPYYRFNFVTNLITNSRATLKSLSKGFIVLIMLSLVGFTYMNNEDMMEPGNNPGTLSVSDDEYLVNTSLVEYIDKGIMKASWYGPRFHGRLTANGEIYDQMAFTAAHKKMKFGTLLRITNPKNNRTVVVRINDRGPYIPGRQLDLSKAAAIELGMLEKGVAKLKVEEVTLKGMNLPVITFN